MRMRKKALELAVPVKANVRKANVMPELKLAARINGKTRQLSKGLTV
jgi:hypothetical protein